MHILKWLAIGISVLALGLVLAGQAGFFTGAAPTDLGVSAGRLKAPSLTDNSVSSQADLHSNHPQLAYARIAPLALKGDGAATLAHIKTTIQATPGAVLVTETPDYLYAQYTSRLMKFVDDVEFWFDPVNQVIQVRSASRVGKGDMGVNRKRIEAVRAALAQQP